MIHNVAPYGLIRKDFESLTKRETLDTAADIEEIIFMQSMEGRAHNGAGFFHKRYYVNTTVDDIVRSLERDPDEIKSRRQVLIDEIFGYVKGVVGGKPGERLLNELGQPLLGIPHFRTRRVNARDVLKGVYIGGLRDDPGTRKKTEEKFDVRIGYGKCYLVDVDAMERLGHNGETLAHLEHEKEIDDFRKKGMIVEKARQGECDGGAIRYLYIRHKEGPGHSDDAAIVSAGLLYNVDVALGVFLSDAVDTLDKYVFDYRDQDYEISNFIEGHFDGLDTSADEVCDLTYLAAIPEGMEERVPDSSLRYFLSVDEDTNQTALQSHIRFIEKQPFHPMYLAYNRILSTEFYAYLKKRIFSLKKTLVPVTVEIEKLGYPASDVMERRFITVNPDARLSDVLASARESDCELAVVQDGEKNVLGVINSTEFIHLLEEISKNKKEKENA